MREYKELLDAVSELEGSNPPPSVSYVDMEIGEGEALAVPTPRKFAQLMGELSGFDTGAQLPKQKKPQPPAMQKPIPKSAQPPIGPESKNQWAMPGFKLPAFKRSAPAAQRETEGKAEPEWQPAPPEKEATVQKPAPRQPLESSAAMELGKAMRAARIRPAPAPPPAEVKKAAQNLVLPSLSLTDQVSELDKIVENLTQGRFNDAQMEVVKEEVRGLSDELKSQPEPTTAPTPFEQDLMNLRKARLAEALALIKGS